MASDKSKLKDDSFWSRLVWPSTDEFDAPYGMDECIQRLEVLGAKYHDKPKSIWLIPLDQYKVDGLQDNGGVFNFQSSGGMSKVILEAKLNGQLIFTGEHITRVKVQVGFTASSVAWLVGTLLIFPVFIFITTRPSSSPEMVSNLIIAVPISILFLFIQILFAYSLKAELRYSLRNALTPPSPTHPRTLPP